MQKNRKLAFYEFYRVKIGLFTRPIGLNWLIAWALWLEPIAVLSGGARPSRQAGHWRSLWVQDMVSGYSVRLCVLSLLTRSAWATDWA